MSLRSATADGTGRNLLLRGGHLLDPASGCGIGEEIGANRRDLAVFYHHIGHVVEPRAISSARSSRKTSAR